MTKPTVTLEPQPYLVHLLFSAPRQMDLDALAACMAKVPGASPKRADDSGGEYAGLFVYFPEHKVTLVDKTFPWHAIITSPTTGVKDEIIQRCRTQSWSCREFMRAGRQFCQWALVAEMLSRHLNRAD